jgi:hypothetical protein
MLKPPLLIEKNLNVYFYLVYEHNIKIINIKNYN